MRGVVLHPAADDIMRAMFGPGARALLLAACGVACARAARPVAPSPPPPPLPGRGVAEHDLSTWATYPRASAKRFKSRGHGAVWVEVAVDSDHVEAYKARTLPAPTGMQVIMIGFESQTGPPVGIDAMIKTPQGWTYAVLAPDGVSASAQGRLEVCEACHRHAPGGDHLFGTRQIEGQTDSPPDPPR
jgi:hypothetical protein